MENHMKNAILIVCLFATSSSVLAAENCKINYSQLNNPYKVDTAAIVGILNIKGYNVVESGADLTIVLNPIGFGERNCGPENLTSKATAQAEILDSKGNVVDSVIASDVMANETGGVSSCASSWAANLIALTKIKECRFLQ